MYKKGASHTSSILIKDFNCVNVSECFKEYKFSNEESLVKQTLHIFTLISRDLSIFKCFFLNNNFFC